MWAIGVIASILVSGESIFINIRDEKYAKNPRESILQMAAECDLSVLDTGFSWQTAGKRAKDFVKQLLLLDESKRMTVKQALAHSWFTNRINLDDFQKLYQRAISDWQRRSRNAKVIQSLCISNSHSLQQSSLAAWTTLTTSHHFPKRTAACVEQPEIQTMTEYDTHLVDETALPQILEEHEVYQPLYNHKPDSTLSQRARNLIAKDIEEMDMSLALRKMSLEHELIRSDVELNEADEEEPSPNLLVPIVSPPIQPQHIPNANHERRECESPDPIAVAPPTLPVGKRSHIGALQLQIAASKTLELHNSVSPHVRTSMKSYGVTKLSDIYVGDGFDGAHPHANMNYGRMARRRKRVRFS
jgi:serine/threonine protein kinase